MSANISIFVPHNGCPNQCSFCNQFSITSHIHQPDKSDIDKAVEIALNSKNYDATSTEIAFFGGSFTAIDKEYMTQVLSSAYKYVKLKQVKGIRVSTRPDAIDNEILSVLKQYGVTTVELGAQSMRDEVLVANHRGHLSNDVYLSSQLIKDRGFSLGLQMMTGLYKDDDSGALYTCDEFIKIKPDFVRIYPTIVLKNTLLEQLYNNGDYEPQSVNDAAKLCSELLKRFDTANIPVIRLGLHTINIDDYVAGPWHSAFGELCESALVLDKLRQKIEHKGTYIVYVHPSMHSKTAGHGKSNIIELQQSGIYIKVVSDSKLHKNDIVIEEVRLS